MLVDNIGMSMLIDYTVGALERGLEGAREAARISAAIGNLWGQMMVQTTEGLLLYERGDFNQAILMEEKVHGQQHPLFRSLANGVLSMCYGELGAWERAIQFAQAAGEKSDQLRTKYSDWYAVNIIRHHISTGNLERGRQLLHVFLERSPEIRDDGISSRGTLEGDIPQ